MAEFWKLSLCSFSDAEEVQTPSCISQRGAWLGSAVGRQPCSLPELLPCVGDVKQITSSLLAVFYGFSLV